MKDYDLGFITCRCSKRMRRRGKAVRIYEFTPKRKKCPNCGRMCKIKVA